MISDRQVFVIWQERVAGSKQFTNRTSVVNRSIKIRVIANLGRYEEFCFRKRQQAFVDSVLDFRAPPFIPAKNGVQLPAKRGPMRPTKSQ
jgi:hypothetical protein